METRDDVINALIAIERGDIGSLRFGCAPLVDRGLFRNFCSMHKEVLPARLIRPTFGDTAQLAEEILDGTVDAAIVTLPLKHPDLRIEEVRRDPLVVCLRRDDPLAGKSALQPADLEGRLSVLYHPRRHPEAHERLLELLAEANIKVKEYSHASHPSEMQMMVKEGHGLTLVREDSSLDGELTTKPIAGVTWTVDTAVIYHKLRHPKTIPILVRKLGRPFENHAKLSVMHHSLATVPKRPPQAARVDAVQLAFFRDRHELQRNGTE